MHAPRAAGGRLRRVVRARSCRGWQREPATLFAPAQVSDRSDGKIAHLDGLNLSRAWCWRELAPLLPGRRGTAEAAAPPRRRLPHVAGDYMGEHWLASFALLALLPRFSTE